ncbi:MAG: hypothetical protein A2557_01075 [Candidatus Lambdaproteobacteria bacterium RIFOXYD2_FULL_56_26]|uniref:Cytochrome c-552/4 domain-containing protein n=1 Tax=Candidatus Lambdaproteobacteria bacterium RIFOXYD2_FULL_56_26 TaxID=1817773 RepID=A0A1F6GZE8_9PROT|nr:MAG: hypothetical protein A2557_01075 [Candidatus Lambdaproteobacteria bacterium RIFOXYD2_FULL_56_26]
MLLLSLLYLAPPAWGVEFLVTGEFQGEIRPCGCSKAGERGGIERLSSYFKTKGPKGWLWLDLGNFAVEPTDQGELKNDLFYKLYRQHRLFAMLPGPREFAMGKRGIAKRRLPFLLTNHQGELAYTERIKHKEGWQFFGFLSPELLSLGVHKTDLLEGVGAFLARAKTLRSKEWRGVLLFRGNPKELELIQGSGLFEVILPANQAKSEETQQLEFELAQQKFFSPPLQGQGVLELNPESQGAGRVAWLGPQTPLDPTWAKDFAQYDKKVETLFLSSLASQAKLGDKRVYKGTGYCVNCHQAQGEAFEQSKHAHAFDSLEKAGRAHDPDCIVCHTQGYNKGGFLSTELTPNLVHLGCENCHGLAPEGHEKDLEYKKNRKPVTQLVCKGCHYGSHDPRFSFETAYPKIKH